MKIPRIMIAAPKSGSGKTLVTCALLGALKKAGKDPIAFKCGPDYIDPMFHRTVQKIPAENLDTFFLGDAGTRELFADIADVLSELEWDVLQLFLAGLSHKQIAGKLGISEKAVNNAMQRLRRKLRTIFR